MCKLYRFFNRLGFSLVIIAFLALSIFVLCVTAFAAETQMYLYNGVELPDINTVWLDKETYPNALIARTSTGTVYLYVCLDAGDIYSREDGGTSYNAYKVYAPFAMYRLSNDSWKLLNSYASDMPFRLSIYTPVWSTVDLLNEDGSIYLAASEPVPVGGSGTDSSIVSVSVSSLTSSAYPGSTVHFDAAVSGTGSYDSSVTWSVSGAASADTFIDGSGNLTIADNETAAQLTVTATSVQDTSVSGSAFIVVQPFPSVDDLAIVPGKETALQGVAFVQQFSLAYKDGSAYTGPSPVWSFEVTPPDSPFPDLDGEYSWVTISDTGILSISADAPADYMVVLTAKLGDQYLTGGRVFISTETNDYLKDIINGTEEQKGQADSFGDKTDEQFADLEEDVSLIEQVTMPNIDDIDLNIDTQVSGDGMTALAMLLGLFMNSQVISTSMTFAFLFALVAFVIFGKR